MDNRFLTFIESGHPQLCTDGRDPVCGQTLHSQSLLLITLRATNNTKQHLFIYRHISNWSIPHFKWVQSVVESLSSSLLAAELAWSYNISMTWLTSVWEKWASLVSRYLDWHFDYSPLWFSINPERRDVGRHQSILSHTPCSSKIMSFLNIITFTQNGICSNLLHV